MVRGGPTRGRGGTDLATSGGGRPGGAEAPHHDADVKKTKREQGAGSLETTAVGRPGARLHLPGAGTAPAAVEMVYQPRATRLTRALLALFVSWLMLPVVVFIPPHLPWVLAVFVGGLYFAWRFWRGEFYVSSFQGACPRCGTALELRPGARIRSSQTLECYGCHRRPELIIDGTGD